MTVSFVFTNPRHHLEMMAPVADELARRGIRSELISLAELRGHDTPATAGQTVRRALPFNPRRRPSARPVASPAPTPARRERRWQKGPLAQRVVWHLGLRPRMRQLLHASRVVVVPNDAVYPYLDVLAQCRGRGIPTVLLQEGIRFALPDGYAGPVYGAQASAAVCAWGAGSAAHFAATGVPRDRIEVTGAPRLDALDPAAHAAAGVALRAELGLRAPPLAFLSNPIDIQGYGSLAFKLDLFARLLAAAAPVVRPAGIPILVKCHLHEDPADYARVAAASPLADLVHVATGGSIFAAIAASRAAVVLTSTVGLEALLFGVPIGQLEIPGHPFAFEYVSQGAAVPLPVASRESLTHGVAELLEDRSARRTAGRAFVDRHLHDRGRARSHVADVIQRVLTQRTAP